MTERRLTLFPADPWTDIPDKEVFEETLIKVGFLEPNTVSTSGFILGRQFRELLESTYEGIEHYHIPAWVEVYEHPKVQIGSDFQNLTAVKSPYGKEIGDLSTARELLLLLREDTEATWQDPRLPYPVPIHELDFEHYLAFGKHFLQLGIYLKPTDLFLNVLREYIHIEYRYANYWE